MRFKMIRYTFAYVYAGAEIEGRRKSLREAKYLQQKSSLCFKPLQRLTCIIAASPCILATNFSQEPVTNQSTIFSSNFIEE